MHTCLLSELKSRKITSQLRNTTFLQWIPEKLHFSSKMHYTIFCNFFFCKLHYTYSCVCDSENCMETLFGNCFMGKLISATQKNDCEFNCAMLSDWCRGTWLRDLPQTFVSEWIPSSFSIFQGTAHRGFCEKIGIFLSSSLSSETGAKKEKAGTKKGKAGIWEGKTCTQQKEISRKEQSRHQTAPIRH